MAAQQVRQLTLQERFELQAPFLPTNIVTNLFKPDQPTFDLVANTSTTNNGLRALPHTLERTPRWSNDAICPASIVRSFCEYGAKLVAIPPGHPALEQFEEGLVAYMIEGGAKMEIHGKGKVDVNLYVFAEGKWNHPQLQTDFQTPDFQGYVSERLVETSVDGMGRLRALGLARLQEIAREKGGLGQIGAYYFPPFSFVFCTAGSDYGGGKLTKIDSCPGRGLPANAPLVDLPTPPQVAPTPPRPSPPSGTSQASPHVPQTTSSMQSPPPYSPPARVRTNDEGATPTPTVSPTGTRPSTPNTGSPTSTEATETPGPEEGRLQEQGPTPLQGDVGGRGLTARAQAAARLKQIAAHIERRHALSSSAQQPRAESATPAMQGLATSDPSSLGSVDSNITATSGSRKRKATPPRPNLRADTEELFNKNQKQRQTHDWRAENGPGGRTASDWRPQQGPRSSPYLSTPTRNAPRPSSSHENHNRPAQARQAASLPPRPSSEVIIHQHHHNQECRGRCHFEQGSNRGSVPSRPTRFDIVGPGFDYRTLNYGDSASAPQQNRQTQVRTVVDVNGGDSRLSQSPVAGRGSQATAGAGQHNERSTSAPSQLAPALPPFDRVISPPPYSDYSTRPARAQATDFYLPPPRNYTTSQLTRDPHRSLPPNFHDNFQRATYDETSLFSPVSTPMERSRPMALAAGGVELVDSDGRVLRNSEVIAKLEVGEVVESKLDGEGWEVVGKKKASKHTNPKATPQTSNAPIAGPSRLPPRRAAVGKSKLSNVISANEEWVDDMETGSSGEFLHHRSEARELTKIQRQNELDVQERKTRLDRKWKATEKRDWQEWLRKWEEHKKVKGAAIEAETRRIFFIVASRKF